MWLDDHQYVQIYLVGCLVAFFFYLFRVAFLSSLGWITKANIARKNLDKIKTPDTSSFTDKIMTYGLIILLDVALSWISVVMGLWQMFVLLFGVVRDIFSSAPEEIKLLRFPLKNNQDLSREAVWAYVVALNLKTGTEWNEGRFRNELNEIAEDYPSFDRISAIKILEGLKAVDPDSTKWLADRVNIIIDN